MVGRPCYSTHDVSCQTWCCKVHNPPRLSHKQFMQCFLEAKISLSGSHTSLPGSHTSHTSLRPLTCNSKFMVICKFAMHQSLPSDGKKLLEEPQGPMSCCPYKSTHSQMSGNMVFGNKLTETHLTGHQCYRLLQCQGHWQDPTQTCRCHSQCHPACLDETAAPHADPSRPLT